jgi:hypothetical protein
MEKKSIYESPKTGIVSLRVFTPILQDDEPIHQGGHSMDNVVDAKEQQIDFDKEEVPFFVFKNIWEEENEE